jgi:predicted NBD/HSP70 family sugar kinase
MRYFAGLDVSLEETVICVVDENGVIVKEVRATSEPEAARRGLAKAWPTAGAGRPGSVLVDRVAA